MSSRLPCQRNTLIKKIEQYKALGHNIVLEVGPQRRRVGKPYGLNLYSYPPDERFEPVVHFRGWLHAGTLFNVRVNELLSLMGEYNVSIPTSESP